jgi:transcriptional regulator with XRE-family HTH domain
MPCLYNRRGEVLNDRRYMDQVASRLAEMREQRALTLRELSEMSGVAADTINQIELGHRKARPSTLRKLASALEIDVREFYAEPALGKAKAPETGRQERRARITAVRPTGKGPTVTREMLKEVGITVTDAELNSINIHLEGLWRQRGEGGGPVATISLKRDNVDHHRVVEVANKIDDLLLYWVAAGKFTPEEQEAVREYAREKVVTRT